MYQCLLRCVAQLHIFLGVREIELGVNVYVVLCSFVLTRGIDTFTAALVLNVFWLDTKSVRPFLFFFLLHCLFGSSKPDR